MNKNGTSIFTGGIQVELLNALKQFFRFEYDILDCNQHWGSHINGTWTVVVGKVFYKVIIQIIALNIIGFVILGS